MRSALLALTVLCLTLSPSAQERKFYPDDPLLVDNDTLDVPDQPAEIALSDLFDRFGRIMADLLTRGRTEIDIEPFNPARFEHR